MRKEGRGLHAEALGQVLTAFLHSYFPQVRWAGPCKCRHGAAVPRLLPAMWQSLCCACLAMMQWYLPAPYLQYLDYGFTSGMEEQLDVMSGGWVRG